MASDYDVIIIGSGAGGGTLAYRLAPTGLRILLLERGDYIQRELENWDSREVFTQGPLQDPREVDRQGRAAVPPRPALLRRRPDEVLRRDPVPAPRDATSARSATTAASRRRGRSPTTTSSPTTRRPSGSTTCTARRARTRPSRGARRRTRTRRSATSRGSSGSTTTSRAPGCTRSTCPVGVMLDESNPQASRVHPLQQARRLPVHGRGQGRRARLRGPAGADARERHAADERARSSGSRRTSADDASRASSSIATACPSATAANVVVVSCRRGQLRRAAPALGERAPPARARELVRCRRPPLHVAHQLGARRRLEGAEPDAVPEDARRQRLLLRRRRLRLPARPHPDARQVRPRGDQGGRPGAAPRASRSTTSPNHAIDFWLTSEDLPRPRQPRHRRPRRAASTSPTRDTNYRGAPAADREAQGPADAHRLPPDADPEPADPRRAHPARRRRAPVRHGALRRRSGDLRARRQLQGARPRQPVRRRHELLPVARPQ